MEQDSLETKLIVQNNYENFRMWEDIHERFQIAECRLCKSTITDTNYIGHLLQYHPNLDIGPKK
jgi:hypothetical protein